MSPKMQGQLTCGDVNCELFSEQHHMSQGGSKCSQFSREHYAWERTRLRPRLQCVLILRLTRNATLDFADHPSVSLKGSSPFLTSSPNQPIHKEP